MLVRNVTMAEADQLYPLVCASARRELPAEVFRVYLSDALSHGTRRILLALEGGTAVAYVDAEVRPSLADCALVGVIHACYVREDCRGHGIGTGLLMSLATQFKKLGCVSMTATCARVNVRSQDFLEKRGFTRSQYSFIRDFK